MKRPQEVDHAEFAQLLREEGWDQPLPEVTTKALKGWQQLVFWALRAYIVVMLLVVIWAFSHGTHS
ncbi:MAG TPA: hypothetical protein VMV40_06150 [Acidiferrobacter sp.]|nr:hypothetical protein [Acidiferrobacter sp.]